MLLWDHNGFTLDGDRFIPLISYGDDEKANTKVVRLCCSIDSSLKWDIDETPGKNILWHLDFSFSQNIFAEDELAISCRERACSAFVDNVLPEYKESSLGVLIYLDDIPLSNFSTFDKKERFLDLLTDKWQLITCLIPEEYPIFVAFDVRKIGPLDFLYYFRKERFFNLIPILKGSPISFPSLVWEEGKGKLGFFGEKINTFRHTEEKTGLLLPRKNFRKDRALQNLLADPKEDIRILYEDFAVEEWDNLESVIAYKPLSEKQERILQGFQAAGGNVSIFS